MAPFQLGNPESFHNAFEATAQVPRSSQKKKRTLQEEQHLCATIPGRAIVIKDRLSTMINGMQGPECPFAPNLKRQVHSICPPTSIVEKFLETREEFRLSGSGRPYHVELGFHFTKKKYTESIQKMGLLSRRDREKLGINVKCNGTLCGEGIYTLSDPADPDQFSVMFGNCVILVAGILGFPTVATKSDYIFRRDSTIVNFRGFGTGKVYSQSKQCLPLVYFRARELLKTPEGLDLVYGLRCEIQAMLDELMNNGIVTHVRFPVVKSDTRKS